MSTIPLHPSSDDVEYPQPLRGPDPAEITPTPHNVGVTAAPAHASAGEEVIGAVIGLAAAVSAVAGTSDRGKLDCDASLRAPAATPPETHAAARLDVHLDLAPVQAVHASDEWDGPSAGDSSAGSFNLSTISDRRLRSWSNRLFRALDMEFPESGAVEDYERIRDELERREETATDSLPVPGFRETIRDNTPGQQFELLRDGCLVGYMTYSMRAGVILLHTTVVVNPFQERGV